MKKAYWIDGRLLTERDLQDIRAQLEGFKSVTAISDEMRDGSRRNGLNLPLSTVARLATRATHGNSGRGPQITTLSSRAGMNELWAKVGDGMKG
jgi:hypothetical protein